MILHILNGDCALNGWEQCGFSGEVLVWRENYLQGMVPDLENFEEFNRIRADELHKIAPEKSAVQIFAELQAMHEKLFALKPADKLVLWLDLCPFDQALKKRLLQLVFAMQLPPELYLIEQDVIWNRETFEQYRNWKDYLCRSLNR